MSASTDVTEFSESNNEIEHIVLAVLGETMDNQEKEQRSCWVREMISSRNQSGV